MRISSIHGHVPEQVSDAVHAIFHLVLTNMTRHIFIAPLLRDKERRPRKIPSLWSKVSM